MGAVCWFGWKESNWMEVRTDVEPVKGQEETVGVDEGGELQMSADKVVVAVADAGDLGQRSDEGLVVVEAVHGVDVVAALGLGEGAPDGVSGVGLISEAGDAPFPATEDVLAGTARLAGLDGVLDVLLVLLLQTVDLFRCGRLGVVATAVPIPRGCAARRNQE
jgi:hypothetical protein